MFMHVTVTGRNIDLTPALKDYLIEKLKRAQKHFDQPLDATALLSVAKNPSIANNQTAEVTLKVNGTVIRGEESTENMYASIDLVADKIERQLRKYKTRYWSRSTKGTHRGQSDASPVLTDVGAEEDDDLAVVKAIAFEPNRPKIVRSKKFPLKPMKPEEAASHMDLLGHDFFMFINSETGQVNTVYHRRDGNYGLIEPEA
jgi:putative sigma-54 modulation protein